LIRKILYGGIFSVVVTAALTASSFAMNATATAVRRADVRACAKSSSTLLTHMEVGETRTILRMSRTGNWCKIKINGEVGYVYTQNLSLDFPDYETQTSYRYTQYTDKDGLPEGATISSGGCCPVSIGNILRNYCGIEEATTLAVCQLATDCGARYNGGTHPLPLLEAAQEQWGGFQYTYTKSKRKLKEHIESGGMALAHTPGLYGGATDLFADSGHYVAIIGQEDASTLTVMDPFYLKGKWHDNETRRNAVTTTDIVGMVNVKTKAVTEACDYYYLIERE
jgi:uncharacterized protein YgiM (DUF1202 family)